MSAGRHRVAVVGIGVKTPAGLTVDTFWSALLAGRSNAGPIQRFDGSGLPVGFACEVGPDFDPVDYLGPKESRRSDRVAHLGFAAATDALASAGDARTLTRRAAASSRAPVSAAWRPRRPRSWSCWRRGPTG